MRVLFPFLGDTVGGSHIAAVRLIREFSNTNVEPVVALHHEGALSAYLIDAGIPYMCLPDSRYVFAFKQRHVFRQLLSIAPRLAWWLHRQRVDIVHTNDQRMFWTWLVPTLLAHKKFLLHFRYLLTSEHPTHLKLIPKAHAIVCDSTMVMESLPANLRGRATIIRSSIDWDRPLPDRRAAKARILKKIGGVEDTRIIGYFGNFIARKRPLLFVEAAARISRACREPIAFVMYGDDRDGFTPAIRDAADERGLLNLIHIMGFASPPEDYMAGCDLLIAPAVHEPLGLTLLEACFVGTPVIAADDAGHRETYGAVVPEFLATPDDPDEFSRKALLLLYDSQTSHKLVAKARAALSNRFSLASYAHSITQVYEGIRG